MNRNIATFMAIALTAVAFFSTFSTTVFANPFKAQSEPETIEVYGRTMGPIKYNVTIADYPESADLKKIQAEVQSTLDRVNQLMSTYIPDSDVSRFNNSESTQPIEVSVETALVVARALEISRQTEGAFDITVGPAVNLWNFGPDKQKFKPPLDSEIESVKELIGFAKLKVDLEASTLTKSISGLKIDLSAIAKGYAVDAVASALDELDCKSYLVEVGGEVRALGKKSDGSPWKVGVEFPTKSKSDPVGKLAAIASLNSRSMATSGDYRNFEMYDGQRYSHTIDPVTCRPVTHVLASACVVAEDCMTADALATAVSVLGAERGGEVCSELGFEYFFLDRDIANPDKFDSKSSKKFPEFKEVQSAPSESIWPAFLGALVIFGLAILAMAVGSIFANKPVTGSCGGLANMTNEDGDEACGVCAKPTTDCVERATEAASG
jgi:thiamine biosynthesis lipoprotein